MPTDPDDPDDPVIPEIPEDIPPVYEPGETLTGLTAYRVARKVNFWGKKEITPGFEAFDVENADLGVLYKTRIAFVAEPEIRKTLMFMTAGQKFGMIEHSNGVTGQQGDWDADCNDEICENITLEGQSFAMKLRSLNWFDAETTWMAVGLDNNFDYTATKNKRTRLVAGFTQWITSQITDDTETIVLAGSSRGGCLSLRIAQEIRAIPEYDHITLFVSSYDGVCHKGDELGVDSPKIENPLRSKYAGYATDIEAQYATHENLYIFHLSGGQEVVPLLGIRTFSAYEGDTPPKVGSHLDFGWYRQKWVPYAHMDVGTAYHAKENIREQAISDTIDSQLYWMQKKLFGDE